VNEWADVLLATTNPLPNAVAGASGGIFIAGTNAATTVTTSFTTTFTGSLTGNVDGTVASVVAKTGYALVSTGADLILKSSTFALAIADAIWDEAQSSHVAVGSFGIIATEIASILVDTETTLDTKINDIQGTTFNTSTDSLEALRNRGDSAWVTATGFSTHTAANVRTEMDSNSTQLVAIVADTNELQGDNVPGLIAALNDLSTSDIDTRLAAIGLDHLVSASVTGTDITDNSIIAKLVSKESTADWDDFVNTTESLQALRDNAGTAGAALTDLGGMSTTMKAEVNTQVDTAFTTQMADSVPSDGTISTREQALYAILQVLTDFAISDTTMTVRKVDGSTELFTLELNDDTSPTSLTRAT
jgi:uncharacterized tellurite resistance protein B-like protein